MQCEETTVAHMEKKKTVLASLPEELIIQILMRLPVMSLIRFKCVCKSWLSLISDPHFANSHFQHSAATPTRRILFITGRVLFMSPLPPRKSRSIDFDASSLHDDSACASLNLNCMPFESYFSIEIKGSCRGFLLLHCYSEPRQPYWIYDIYLWNPSTGFHKKIPSSPFAYYLGDCYGFGYDQSTDDYLLFKMSSEVNQHLEFFSSRANTWKVIEGTQFSYTRPIGGEHSTTTTGFLFNGAIHWFAYCRELRENVIVAFNLMEKKLFNLHLPHDFDRKPYRFGLWAFGEFLALWAVYSDHFKFRLEEWVMKEYKANSPWTKTLVLPFEGYYPLCSTKSGDIITNNGSELPKYNDQGQRRESRSYLDNGCEVALYIESLLSLPDNEKA